MYITCSQKKKKLSEALKSPGNLFPKNVTNPAMPGDLLRSDRSVVRSFLGSQIVQQKKSNRSTIYSVCSTFLLDENVKKNVLLDV